MLPGQVFADVDRMPAILLQDDFSDGDYTVSPEWIVSSGNWSIAADPLDGSNNTLYQSDTGKASFRLVIGCPT